MQYIFISERAAKGLRVHLINHQHRQKPVGALRCIPCIKILAFPDVLLQWRIIHQHRDYLGLSNSHLMGCISKQNNNTIKTSLLTVCCFCNEKLSKLPRQGKSQAELSDIFRVQKHWCSLTFCAVAMKNYNDLPTQRKVRRSALTYSVRKNGYAILFNYIWGCGLLSQLGNTTQCQFRGGISSHCVQIY